jgi:hypothetical protein
VRARVTALAVAVLTAAGMLAVFTPGSASAASFPGSAAFSGYSTGTAVHADVLQVPGAPRLVDGEIAFSGEAANTAGLNGGVINEMNETVATSSAKNSYGRGSAVELGIGTTVPDATKDVNQAIITGLAESSAPPERRSGHEGRCHPG